MALEKMHPLELRHLLVDWQFHDLPLLYWFAISQGLLDQRHGHMGSSARFPSPPNLVLQNNLECK
jgi:hypothetical protein